MNIDREQFSNGLFFPEFVRISKARSDFLKAILIMFVVADHSDLLRGDLQQYFRPMTFHVIGFFLLNFLSSILVKGDLLLFVRDRLVRYIWPFILFYFIYSAVAVLHGGFGFKWLENFFLGIAVGSFETIKLGSGVAFLWFLPAIFSFSVFAQSMNYMGKWLLYAFILLSIVFFVFAGDMPISSRMFVPYGVGVSLYVFPYVLLFFLVMQRLLSDRQWFFKIFFSVFAGVLYLTLVKSGKGFEVGALDVPGGNYFLTNILSFVSALMILQVLWWLSEIKQLYFSFLMEIGKYSLVIYLLHPVIQGGLYLLYRWGGFVNFLPASVGGVVLVAISIVLSLLLARLVFRSEMFSLFVFPKDWLDLKKIIIMARDRLLVTLH